MTEHTTDTAAHQHVNAYGIFIWLTVITVVEVGGVIVFDMPQVAKAIFLVGTAIAKALLVALYFMELRWEKKLIVAMIVTPVVLAIAFVLVLFPDIVYGFWS